MLLANLQRSFVFSADSYHTTLDYIFQEVDKARRSLVDAAARRQ
jgi:hypothetical protein